MPGLSGSGSERVRMQTEAAIARPLQAARSALCSLQVLRSFFDPLPDFGQIRGTQIRGTKNARLTIRLLESAREKNLFFSVPPLIVAAPMVFFKHSALRSSQPQAISILIVGFCGFI